MAGLYPSRAGAVEDGSQHKIARVVDGPSRVNEVTPDTVILYQGIDPERVSRDRVVAGPPGET